MEPSFADTSEISSLESMKYHQLSIKKEELHSTKEQVKQAKDDAMQSWLDSRPLIDELEKLQTSLADAKNRSNSTELSHLESQLKEIHMKIKSKKEENLRTRKMINEMTQNSEKAREEMEQVKLDIEEEYRVRIKLKQMLKLRRQSLRTLKLTMRAMRLETDAYGASAVVASQQISSYAQLDSNTVQLTQEDYYALTRRAKEEASLAEWRAAVSFKQRLVAQEARDAASRRLKEPDLDRTLTKRKIDEEIIEDENVMRGTEGGSRRTRMRAQTPFPKARTKHIAENGHKKPKGKTNRKMVGKKKKSIFVQIRAFLVQKMAMLFK